MVLYLKQICEQICEQICNNKLYSKIKNIVKLTNVSNNYFIIKNDANKNEFVNTKYMTNV
jgi:hypothetical protein